MVNFMVDLRHTPLVSIIVACHNGEKYVDECISSLINQTYSNIEIVICDDCSTDNSYEKLIEWQQKDNRIIILKNTQNLFAASSRNKCIHASHGSYLMIQDIDDISESSRILTLLDSFQHYPGYSFISSAMSVFNEEPDKPYMILKMKRKFPTKWDFMFNLPFNHPATMFTRDCLLNINGYESNKYTRRMEDYDLFMRLYAKGYKGVNIEPCLYRYRQDIANIKRRTFSSRIDEYKIRLRDFKMLGLMPLAIPFVYKPFLAYWFQKIRYRKLV